MKLLHTSDWHLGKKDGDTSLYEDQLFFIEEICRVVKEENIDAVLIAGDVYDRAVSSADAGKLYNYAMTKLCKDCGVSVFIIAGNHDSAVWLSNCNQLLCDIGLHIRGELSENVVPIPFEDCEFFLLPWITEEKVRSVFPEKKTSVSDLDSAYRVVTDRMREHFSTGKRHILLSHAFLSKAETSFSDRTAEIGFASQISSTVFDGFDYVALGHLHGPQAITAHIRYSGTPMPYSFGKEETQTKGVVIINTDTMEQEFHPIRVLHKRTTLECTLAEAMNPLCDDETRQGYVRLHIIDSYVGLETLSDLRKLYSFPIEVEGKSFESENSSVTLTMQQLEEMETDPLAVFRHFCSEEMGEEPDGHLDDLFLRAVEDVEKEKV